MVSRFCFAIPLGTEEGLQKVNNLSLWYALDNFSLFSVMSVAVIRKVSSVSYIKPLKTNQPGFVDPKINSFNDRASKW